MRKSFDMRKNFDITKQLVILNNDITLLQPSLLKPIGAPLRSFLLLLTKGLKLFVNHRLPLSNQNSARILSEYLGYFYTLQ